MLYHWTNDDRLHKKLKQLEILHVPRAKSFRPLATTLDTQFAPVCIHLHFLFSQKSLIKKIMEHSDHSINIVYVFILTTRLSAKPRKTNSASSEKSIWVWFTWLCWNVIFLCQFLRWTNVCMEFFKGMFTPNSRDLSINV